MGNVAVGDFAAIPYVVPSTIGLLSDNYASCLQLQNTVCVAYALFTDNHVEIGSRLLTNLRTQTERKNEIPTRKFIASSQRDLQQASLWTDF